jgi:hypothetical protein
VFLFHVCAGSEGEDDAGEVNFPPEVEEDNEAPLQTELPDDLKLGE